MIRNSFYFFIFPAMIVLWATVAGCSDTHRCPPALHGQWQRTAEYPGVTLHTTLHLAPDGALTHNVEARLATGGDTLRYRVSARGRWYLQRSLGEFRLLQAEYDSATLRRYAPADNPNIGTAVRRALPPTWDALDASLIEDGGPRSYPYTLLEVTDTTTALTGLGAYHNVISLTRL